MKLRQSCPEAPYLLEGASALGAIDLDPFSSNLR